MPAGADLSFCSVLHEMVSGQATDSNGEIIALTTNLVTLEVDRSRDKTF